MWFLNSSVLLCVLINFSFVLSEPTECYQCNDDTAECVDGVFNSTNSRLIQCDDIDDLIDLLTKDGSDFYSNSDASAVSNAQAHAKNKFNLQTLREYKNEKYEVVCLTASYVGHLSRRNKTIRTCAPKQLGDNSACNLVNLLGTVSYCETCETDLCNSSTMLRQSIVALLIFSVMNFFK